MGQDWPIAVVRSLTGAEARHRRARGATNQDSRVCCNVDFAHDVKQERLLNARVLRSTNECDKRSVPFPVLFSENNNNRRQLQPP